VGEHLCKVVGALCKEHASVPALPATPGCWCRLLLLLLLLLQVVSTALPESRNPEQVSVTVKAFMKHDLQVRGWGGGGRMASERAFDCVSVCVCVGGGGQVLGMGYVGWGVLMVVQSVEMGRLIQPCSS